MRCTARPPPRELVIVLLCVLLLVTLLRSAAAVTTHYSSLRWRIAPTSVVPATTGTFALTVDTPDSRLETHQRAATASHHRHFRSHCGYPRQVREVIAAAVFAGRETTSSHFPPFPHSFPLYPCQPHLLSA
ncbi:unnamed protein product [Closterium sp. NIES-54]